MPLQLIGFAWLWADSDSQLSRLIRQGENTIAALLSRILASGSAADLQGLLAASNLGPLPPLESGSLADQKQQLSEAIAINAEGYRLCGWCRRKPLARAHRSAAGRSAKP